MRWRAVFRAWGLRAVVTAAAAALAGGTALTAAPRASGAPASGPPGATEAVARVNGAAILRRDFDLAVQVEFRRRGRGQRRHEDLEAVRNGVLEALIDKELLCQKARAAGIGVTHSEIADAVKKLKAGLGTPQEAAGFLKQAGLTDANLSDEVRCTIAIGRFLDREVAHDIAVSDADARAWYDAHPEAVRRPEAVHISQIVVQVPSDASPDARAEARRKIEAILKELHGGKDFASLARRYSEGPEAEHGGDSGWVWIGGGALPQVERAALALQPGQTTDVVETRRGFHILKAIERRPAGSVPFEEAKKKIVDLLRTEKRESLVKEYVAGLHKTARIQKLLK